MHIIIVMALVLFVGDSLTAADPGYVNYAGGGERAVTYHLADSILHLQEVGRYDRIILELGIHAVHGSDRLYANDPELFRRRYAQLLDTALSQGREVIALNVPWLDWGPKKTARALHFNAIIAEECAARGIAMVDTWSIMEDCGPACIGEDGFHPNQEGHQRIAASIPPAKARVFLPILWR